MTKVKLWFANVQLEICAASKALAAVLSSHLGDSEIRTVTTESIICALEDFYSIYHLDVAPGTNCTVESRGFDASLASRALSLAVILNYCAQSGDTGSA
jgi:phosphotransferase system HPr-like phosphotransfer protein